MNELQRHRLVFAILMPFVTLFTKWKFNYEYDDLSKIEGPYLLLPNHNLELDPLLVGVAAKNHLYFVASEHIMRKGIATWALMTFLKPIIHMKGRQGTKTVKQMLRTLRDGHSICIFPEGNRSFNGITREMEATIGRVAKSAKVKLITFRVEGGYLTQPRWSMRLRKGKIKGHLVRVYEPEELARMSDEAINQAIISDLYEDAYETQEKERVAFRGKNLAECLETTIFSCPQCGEIGHLHSQGERFYCDCGFEAVYDVYGYLTDTTGRKYTVTELDELQRAKLEERIGTQESVQVLFEDLVTVCQIDAEHDLTGAKEGKVTAYIDRLEIDDEILYFKELEGMAIYSRNCLIIHSKKQTGHLELKSDNRSFSALKYLYLYEYREGS